MYTYKRTSLNATALCASRTGTSVRPSVNWGSTAPGWFSIYLFVWFLSLINLQCMSKIREKIWFNQKSESCQTIFLRACFFISTFLVFFWKKWPIDQLRMSIHNQLMIQRAYNVFKWIESIERMWGGYHFWSSRLPFFSLGNGNIRSASSCRACLGRIYRISGRLRIEYRWRFIVARSNKMMKFHHGPMIRL